MSKKHKAAKRGIQLAPRSEMEHTLRNLQRLLEGKNFKSAEEANAYLARLGPDGVTEALEKLGPADPKEQAQDLAFQAMNAASESQALALAGRALALDPDCVDALALRAELTAKSDQDFVRLLGQAVEAGERDLGPAFFRENRGHFWGLVETRPYMRVRLQLAQLLKHSHRVHEAIEHFEALMDLNPNDNQGVRDHLLASYLYAWDHEHAGYLAKARRILERYREDSAVFNWSRVLERVLRDDFLGAAKALKAARKQNPHVERYLSLAETPGGLPDYYSPGDKTEAAHCMYTLGLAWIKHPQAFYYLQGALGERAGKLPAPRGGRGPRESPDW